MKRVANILMFLVAAAGALQLMETHAFAIKYIHYTNAEIIDKADIVIEGLVSKIIQPTDTERGDKAAASVAIMKVLRVFKGEVKIDQEIGLEYWSHEAKGQHDWTQPSKYEAGTTLMLALEKKREKEFDFYIAPKEAATAAWVNHFNYPHHSVVQSKSFRTAAETFAKPEEGLQSKDTEVLTAAIYFCAKKKPAVPSPELVAAVTSGINDCVLDSNTEGERMAQRDLLITAVNAAGDLQILEAIPAMLKRMNDQNMVPAFRKLGAPVIEPLIEAITLPDVNYRRANALHCLGQLLTEARREPANPDPRIVPALLAILESDQEYLVSSACYYLKGEDLQKHVPHLKDILATEKFKSIDWTSARLALSGLIDAQTKTIEAAKPGAIQK